jgi:peroxiredoxin
MKAGGETAVPTSTSGAATVSEPSLPVGTPAPGFSLSGLHGETLTLEALRAAGQPVVLIFVDPNCGPCNALLPEIGRWQRTYHGALTMALVTRGAPEVNRSKSTEHGLTYVLLQLDREVAQAYQAHGTPSGVLVRPDGTIGSPLAHGATAIRSLVERGARESASIPTIGVQSVLSPDSAVSGTNGSEDGAAAPTQPAARIGTPAPTLRLPDLEGHAVDLQSFHGERVLVLFWNPACGFCARMLNALKAWDDAALPGAPRLLVVSTGSTEANRNMGLRSTVVLDQGFVIGQSFGTSGTPSAVLVDADGLVASEVAVGAKAILKLAGVLPAEPVATR